MSNNETEKKPVVTLSAEPQGVIERNGVSLNLYEYKVIKGDQIDQKYLAPKPESEEFDKVVSFYDKTTILNILKSWTKKTFQEAWFGLVDDTTGLVDFAKFQRAIAELTSASASKKELLERWEELQLENSRLLDTMPDGDDIDALIAWKNNQGAKMKKISIDIAYIKDQIESRSRKTKQVEAAPSVEAV